MNTVSVVTVVYNDVTHIEQTILSTLSQTYSHIEYAIIDGGSNDGTLDIIERYKDKIDIFVSEPDRGIYDAMNKAVKRCTGEWIIFMNSGDCFQNELVLENVFSENIPSNTEIIYSDFSVKFDNDKVRNYKASYEKGILLHQSIIYKRNIHEKYGYYIVSPQYIVSDYIFFLCINEVNYFKSSFPISVNDAPGVSANGNWCGYQKYCIDYVFRRISIAKLIRNIGVLTIHNIIKNFFGRK